jgi:hypothetical protein
MAKNEKAFFSQPDPNEEQSPSHKPKNKASLFDLNA